VKLSVVIPAWNEEGLLPACLASVGGTLGEIPGLDVELIVVDNNSTDRTAAVARAAGAHVVYEARNQIARARNAGAAAARGDWLLFLDADSRLNPGLAAELLAAVESGRWVACGSTVQMDGLPWWARILLWAWNGSSRLCRVAAGCFLACRADAFRAVGGFDEGLYATEELDLSRRLRRWGRRRRQGFRILSRYPLFSSARKLELYSGQEIFAQLGRVLARPWRSVRDREALAIWYDGRR
jgi:glycosyltransferase involved in cell wall biosynthesis